MTDQDQHTEMREIARATQVYAARHYATVLQAAKAKHTPVIDMLELPTCDEYGTMTIGTWGGYHVQIMPMLFNDRLILTPQTASWGYDHGWCYPKGGSAYLAALVWDPQADGEPAGYKKRATAGLRQPGQTAPAEDRQWMGDALMALLAGMEQQP